MLLCLLRGYLSQQKQLGSGDGGQLLGLFKMCSMVA